MHIFNINRQKDEIFKEYRLDQQVLDKMDKKSPEEVRTENRVGEDSGVTTERSAAHTCNSEATVGCVVDAETQGVEPPQEKE